MTRGCSNCGAAETDAYELTPEQPTSEVDLCPDCHASLDDGFVWAD
jgi:NAD-dependent SIR2 family protein deacetylase